ncbi:hypothetical protein GCM10009733_103150 [Nonomuraea maheshkhaliensis]|uniref:Uncharacterized protein n=1 Tax=Nonomuraea maheshkhaliensis TaxID=419590 RepID=A0ABN2HMF9_9ACTN
MLTVHQLVYSALALLMAGTATLAQTTGPPSSTPAPSSSASATKPGGTRDEMRSFIGGAIMADQKFTPRALP